MIIKSFRRKVADSLIENIKKEPLFTECLLPDIQIGRGRPCVFPAIRNGRIDFYHAGGKLFSYREGAGFSTHVKYATVLTGITGDYVTELKLKQAQLIQDFRSGYKSIKANCARYAGIEAAGVAGLCARSWFTHADADVVALDLEVSFSRDSAWGDQQGTALPTGKDPHVDRPDILLHDRRSRTLRFYEAKHYSNSELWAVPGAKPQVVDQLVRYNRILGNAEAQRSILDAYGSYIRSANELFELDMPTPEVIEPDAVLYVFGYDAKQAKKIKELLIDDGSLEGHRLRCRGNTGDRGQTAAALWQRVVVCNSSVTA